MPAADTFANQAVITATESAANTLTFKKLETGVSLFDKVAWIIHRIEYFFFMNATNWNGADDNLSMAIVAANNLTALSLTDPNVLDLFQVSRQDYGTAASMVPGFRPTVKDFATLPGGGLITVPNPIYGAVQGSGLVAAQTVYIKFFYSVLELKVEQYWELVEARRIIAS
jgi:hypothetical protein